MNNEHTTLYKSIVGFIAKLSNLSINKTLDNMKVTFSKPALRLYLIALHNIMKPYKYFRNCELN